MSWHHSSARSPCGLSVSKPTFGCCFTAAAPCPAPAQCPRRARCRSGRRTRSRRTRRPVRGRRSIRRRRRRPLGVQQRTAGAARIYGGVELDQPGQGARLGLRPTVQTGDDPRGRAGAEPEWIADGDHVRTHGDAAAQGCRDHNLGELRWSERGDVDLRVGRGDRRGGLGCRRQTGSRCYRRRRMRDGGEQPCRCR